MEAFTTLAACLPSKYRSDLQEDVRAEAYHRMLGGYPLASIEHLERVALQRFEWFPTIAQCIGVLDEIPSRHPLAGKQAVVRFRLHNEQQWRLEEAMEGLRSGDCPSQAWIDALPEQWKAIAEARSLLWRHPDGSYALRREPRR